MSSFAIIMLASGLSKRFGHENKLLSAFRGKPVCSHSATLGNTMPKDKRIAIVPSSSPALFDLYQSQDWTVIQNAEPHRGQSHSLILGIQAAQKLNVGAVIICLADMPLIDETHLDLLRKASFQSDAVMSQSEGVLLPPAAFASSKFEELLELKGDAGAKKVFLNSRSKAVIDLPIDKAMDVDTSADLMALNKTGADCV